MIAPNIYATSTPMPLPWRTRLLILRVKLFGGNFGYEVEYLHANGFRERVWHGGWMPNLVRRVLKFYREGWGRNHGTGQHVYTMREFCWRMPHEH